MNRRSEIRKQALLDLHKYTVIKFLGLFLIDYLYMYILLYITRSREFWLVCRFHFCFFVSQDYLFRVFLCNRDGRNFAVKVADRSELTNIQEFELLKGLIRYLFNLSYLFSTTPYFSF